jgi:hypothetical protein
MTDKNNRNLQRKTPSKKGHFTLGFTLFLCYVVILCLHDTIIQEFCTQKKKPC